MKLENSAEKSVKTSEEAQNTDRLDKLCSLKACKVVKGFHQP